MLKLITGFVFFCVLALGCSNKPCDHREQVTQKENATAASLSNSENKKDQETKPTQQPQQEKQSVTEKTSDPTQRVRVYKADGSLQCGMGKKIEPSEMQKELGSIKVYSSENKHDGMMRVQVCGHPTGQMNVYEIQAKDLDAALKLGFKKWIRD